MNGNVDRITFTPNKIAVLCFKYIFWYTVRILNNDFYIFFYQDMSSGVHVDEYITMKLFADKGSLIKNKCLPAKKNVGEKWIYDVERVDFTITW